MPWPLVRRKTSMGLPSSEARDSMRVTVGPLAVAGACSPRTWVRAMAAILMHGTASFIEELPKSSAGIVSYSVPACRSRNISAPHMPALEFQHVSKSFGAVHALRDVSFSVDQGSAHAIVGENGAGKSTLLKVLAGIVQPDQGAIRWDGVPLRLGSPREAVEHGIGMVYQEMLSFPNRSVTANIFAGREITRIGRLRHAEMRERTQQLLAR